MSARMGGVVVGLALAFAPCSFAEAVQEVPEPCRFKFIDRLGRPVEVAADGADCGRLERMSPLFERLREAAGFSAKDVRHFDLTLWSDETPKSSALFGPNASYSPSRRAVNVNVEFARRHGDKEPVVLAVLAHELAHAIQHRNGQLGRPGDEPRSSRVVEAQADVIAQQILVRAGFRAQDFTAGFEGFAGCKRIEEAEPEPGGTHPTEGRRWLNALQTAGTINARSRPRMEAVLDDAGGWLLREAEPELPGPHAVRPLNPIFPRSRFDEDGGLRPQWRSKPAKGAPGTLPSPQLRAPEDAPLLIRARETLLSWWRESPTTTALALRACGGLPTPGYNAAVVQGFVAAAAEASVLHLMRGF